MAASRSKRPHPSSSPAERDAPRKGVPWWKSGWMWLVVAVPAVTLAAAIATTMLALGSPDNDAELQEGYTPAHRRQANS